MVEYHLLSGLNKRKLSPATLHRCDSSLNPFVLDLSPLNSVGESIEYCLVSVLQSDCAIKIAENSSCVYRLLTLASDSLITLIPSIICSSSITSVVPTASKMDFEILRAFSS